MGEGPYVSIASGDTINMDKNNATAPFLHPEESFALNREDEVDSNFVIFLRL